MVTRDIIRQGIANYIHLREQNLCIYLDDSYPCQGDGCDNCTARAIIKYLDSQGLRLPNGDEVVPKYWPYTVCLDWETSERHRTIYTGR